MSSSHEPNQFVLSPRLGITVAAIQKLSGSLIRELEGLGPLKLDIRDGLNMREELRRYEIGLIRQALDLTGSNQAKAAKILGLRATTLNSKMKRYNLID